MKRYIALLAVSACCVLNAAEAATNLLSIHLVADKAFPQWRHGSMPKPGDLKLMSPPVLADSDFVSFDVTNQMFAITAEAAKRLARKIWELGKRDAPGWGDAPTVYRTGNYDLVPTTAPFVLKASGEPIYVGAFYTPVSSSSFAGPVIVPVHLFICANLTNNVTFSIQPGYPGEFPGVADQLRDSRIPLAVKKLFTHEKH